CEASQKPPTGPRSAGIFNVACERLWAIGLSPDVRIYPGLKKSSDVAVAGQLGSLFEAGGGGVFPLKGLHVARKKGVHGGLADLLLEGVKEQWPAAVDNGAVLGSSVSANGQADGHIGLVGALPARLERPAVSLVGS